MIGILCCKRDSRCFMCCGRYADKKAEAKADDKETKGEPQAVQMATLHTERVAQTPAKGDF